MSRLAALLLVPLLLAACGAIPAGPSPDSTASPTASSSSVAAGPTSSIDSSVFQPLPEVVAGLPLGGGTPTAKVSAQTIRRLVPDATVAHGHELGHCGLLGPLDFDGSLWVAQGGHNGLGGALTEAQVGELINATQVRLFLLDDQTALLVTPLNAFVLLARHHGAREYALCD